MNYVPTTKKYFLIINDRFQKSFVSTYNLTGLLWPKTSNAVILSKISGAYLFPLPPMVARKAQKRLMKTLMTVRLKQMNLSFIGLTALQTNLIQNLTMQISIRIKM